MAKAKRSTDFFTEPACFQPPRPWRGKILKLADSMFATLEQKCGSGMSLTFSKVSRCKK